MRVCFCVTREPAEPRSYTTPVVSVGVGIRHAGDGKFGAKVFSGDNMWKDLHADLTRICGQELSRMRPSRQIVPAGWNIGNQFGIIMLNFFRSGLRFYDFMQPTTKKWQNALVSDTSRIFTQCAYVKDVYSDEKDAFEFMGLGDMYISEDDRFRLASAGGNEELVRTSKYLEAIDTIHERYSAFCIE